MSAVHRSFPIALFFKKGVGLFGEQNIIYISSRFFENQPDEICSHLSEKASKGRFLTPEKLQVIVTKEKERRKRKSEEKERRSRKKAMAALLVS